MGITPKSIPLTVDQAEQQQLYNQQLQSIKQTEETINTQEEQLLNRREVINQQLREGGKGAGDIERYNRERDILDAKLRAIEEIRNSGIKSPRIARGEFTGIGIRPILTKRKRRKKR